MSEHIPASQSSSSLRAPARAAAPTLPRQQPGVLDVLALQRTAGNAAVSQLLIQRLSMEQFFYWFNRARAIHGVDRRHAFLFESLGIQEFGSFQRWLQDTRLVHEMWGQAPQPVQQQQAAQVGTPYSPSHPTTPDETNEMDVDVGGVNQHGSNLGQQANFGQPPQQQQMGFMAPPQQQMGYPPQAQMGFFHGPQQNVGYPPQQNVGYPPQQFTGYPPQPNFGYAPPELDRPHVTPQQQQFLAQFLGEHLPGDEWRKFKASDGTPVNVHWWHILNHTYRYMYTTDGKPGHSLFPRDTTAEDIEAWIQEAIEEWPNTNPTLSCGTVTVGWDKKKGVDSLVTFFPSLSDDEPDKLNQQQLALVRDHYDFPQ